MNLMRVAFPVLLLAALAAGSQASARVEFDKRLVTVAEDRRTYFLEHDDDVSGPKPVLLVLHGGGGWPEQARRHTGFGLAGLGWAVVYPRGRDKSWNDARTGEDGMPLRDIDDALFLEKTIQALAEEGIADPARVYAAGVSNGGMMIQRILCDRPELLAGVAIVAANYPIGLNCHVWKPTPTMFFHGTDDPLTSWAGGLVAAKYKRDRGAASSASYALELAAVRNECSGWIEQPQVALIDDDTAVVRRDYEDCAAPLIHYIVRGGGHTWPGARPMPLIEGVVGPTSREIDATALIESFFVGFANQVETE